MTVTLSWLDVDFKMQEVVIGFREILGRHTGANIAACFHSIMSEYGLVNKVCTFHGRNFKNLVRLKMSNSFCFQLFCISSDNASNNTTFIREYCRLTGSFHVDRHIRCFAHILHLAATDAMDPFKPLVRKVRIYILYE